MPAGVDVNSHQGFGFVHHEVAAALQVDLARERILQLARDVETVEDRLGVAVELDLVGGTLGDLGNHLPHPVVGFRTIHHDAFNIFGQEVAHGALDQIRFLEDATSQGPGLDAFLDLVPFFKEQRQVAHEVTLLLPLAHGAHDNPHAIGDR